jgi:hypothetical protein
MNKPHTQVTVDALPPCDFCKQDGVEREAGYDGKLNFGTSWANMCRSHFNQYGIGLGLGKGQRLLKRVPMDAVQCEARNKNYGGRCQRMTENANKLCDEHADWIAGPGVQPLP